MQPDRFDVKTECQGRWRGILMALGCSEKTLSGRNTECPLCQNGPKSDRFRFDDRDGRGTWICSACGAGDGVQLAMKLRRVGEFKDIIPTLRELVGKAAFNAPKAKHDTTPEARDEMASLWKRARPLDGLCLASKYLRYRGIECPPGLPLRFIAELPWSDGKINRLMPAMLAKFVAPDGKSAILHRTWLKEPGEKADVEPCRKMWRGVIPEGGAVRLGPVGETMGIAEGIETALAASSFAKISVWATTSAGALIKFQPPAECKHLIIFADNDASFTGQLAGYSLARRLTSVPADVRIGIEVRLPSYFDTGERIDWNDVILAEQRAA